MIDLAEEDPRRMVLLIQDDGYRNHRRWDTTECAGADESRIADGRVGDIVVLHEVDGSSVDIAADVNAEDGASSLLFHPFLNILQTIRLGVTQCAPLASDVQNHNLVLEAFRGNFLATVLQRRTEDSTNRLAPLRCVVNDLLTTRRNRLEPATNDNGVMSYRFSGVTCRERQRQSCYRQCCYNSGR